MKRIATMALVFVLAGCIMTGCRRNDMQGTSGTDMPSSSESTTITTVPDRAIIPHPSTGTNDNGIGTGPMDSGIGNEGAMPRVGIPGPGR